MITNQDDEGEDLILRDEAKLTRQTNENIVPENFSFDNEETKQVATSKHEVRETISETISKHADIDDDNSQPIQVSVEKTGDVLLDSAMMLVNNSEKTEIDLNIDIKISLPNLNLISTISTTAGVDKVAIIDKILADKSIQRILIESVKVDIMSKLDK